MHKMLNQLITFGALVVSSHAYSAFYINGDVKTDGVTWDNVTYGKGDTMVPSKWGVPPSVRSVRSWSAGSLPSVAATEIVLKGGMNGETTAEIPISITGVQYNTGGTAFSQGSNSSGGGCTTDEVLLPLISVEGIGCISSTKLSIDVPTSPFVLFRPMFHIEEMDVVDALEGRAEGAYTASVPFTIRYYYENTSGVSTYRNISDVMIFSFNYDPVEITDLIIVSGDGVMDPVYDTTNRRVSAQTDYKLEAQGYFNNGIVLAMYDRGAKGYALTHSTSPDAEKIPYNVTCNECSSQQLVNEGTLLIEEVTIGEGTGSGVTNLPFTLSFDYDVEGEPLVSGDYADTVTIMVSPGIL